MVRASLGLVLVTGCQVVFPYEAPPGPDANCARGHDEDNDMVVDGCDPCPQFANQDGDGDLDLVGDRCDPEDGSNQRVRFEGFDTTAAFTAPSGWLVVNDQLIVPAPTMPQIMFFRDPAEIVYVAASITLEVATAVDFLELQAGMPADSAPGSDHGVGCRLTQLPGNTISVIGLVYPDDGVTRKATFTGAGAVEVALHQFADRVDCVVSPQVGLPATLPIRGGSMPRGVVRIATLTHGAVFDWIDMIGRPARGVAR